ncbi:MAG: lipopolysaccharide biosynthesis protein [Coriobacteriaceae bacterium]|nr:lipopolysaccharide biosynthesis protein [Coriobacteriaceae bacterium]
MSTNPLDTIRKKIAHRGDIVVGSPSSRKCDPAERPAQTVYRGAKPQRRAQRERRRPDRQQTFVARIVDEWWSRLLQSVFEGSLSEQEAEYESHSTKRDYIWNTVGIGVWGMVFPLLTVVTTQLVGAEQAGMFSMAFVTGTLIMIASNYGVRTFQVSDIDETSSFASYRVNRWITGIAALLLGVLWCAVRGYDTFMATVSMGVFVYKFVDGVADVYEGRLQQADKLYLAGISQAIRSVAVAAGFSAALFLTRSLSLAAIVMSAVAVASLVLLTAPLALLETEKSRRASAHEVLELLRHCFPLFAALFLFNLIESMPKFVMEGMLPYENQLYFNALYFPAQGILLAIGFVYKPQLLRLASIWANPRKRKKFDLVVIAVMAVIVLITGFTAVFMGWLGIPIMSFMYGLDFERFRSAAFLMIAAGGITAAIDFLYAIITVLRRQQDVMKLYLVSFAASVVAPVVLVALMGLTGAVISYLAVMALLLVLLVLEYVRVRREIARDRNPFS